MRRACASSTLLLLVALAAGTALAQGFRFSQPDDTAAREAAARDERIAQDLSVPCRA
jgi:hypothetical protein